MKRLLLLLLSLFLLLGSFLGGWIASYVYTHPKEPQPQENSISPLDPYKLYDLVNNYRANKGLKKLVFDPSICNFANERIKQIHSEFSHDKFNTYAKEKLGYSIYIGENLANGYYDEKEAVDNWIASPKHLENMVKPEFARTCIATDIFNENSYAVQIFASF